MPSEEEVIVPSKNIKGLLFVVIFMAILIVAGLVVVVVTVMKRANTHKNSDAIRHFGEVMIPVSPAMKLLDSDFRDHQLILRLREKNEDVFILIDTNTGYELGRIRLMTDTINE